MLTSAANAAPQLTSLFAAIAFVLQCHVLWAEYVLGAWALASLLSMSSTCLTLLLSFAAWRSARPSTAPTEDTGVEESLKAPMADQLVEPPVPRCSQDQRSCFSDLPSSNGRYLVLYVDVDPVNQIVMESLLGSAGKFVLHNEYTGEDALHFMENASALPDLVLLDLHMPGVSGFEVAEILRQRYTSAELPIIVISSRHSDSDLLQGLEAGANDYISKPLRQVELLARINTQLKVKDSIKAQFEARSHRNLLTKMLPPRIIRMLKDGRNLIAEEHDEVTILFSDVQGFTAMSAALPTTSIVHMLNEMFTRFDDLCDQNGVYKVETIGDAYMVVAGHDGAKDHACRMLAMALDMLDAMASMPPVDGWPIRIRIGMHTGPAYSGVVGRKCPRYCFFGDTVNTASRMESHGVPMCVHMSATSHARLLDCGVDAAALAEAVEFLDRGPLEVKGKGSMNTYLVQPRAQPNADAGPRARLLSPIQTPNGTMLSLSSAFNSELASPCSPSVTSPRVRLRLPPGKGSYEDAEEGGRNGSLISPHRQKARNSRTDAMDWVVSAPSSPARDLSPPPRLVQNPVSCMRRRHTQGVFGGNGGEQGGPDAVAANTEKSRRSTAPFNGDGRSLSGEGGGNGLASKQHEPGGQQPGTGAALVAAMASSAAMTSGVRGGPWFQPPPIPVVRGAGAAAVAAFSVAGTAAAPGAGSRDSSRHSSRRTINIAQAVQPAADSVPSAGAVVLPGPGAAAAPLQQPEGQQAVPESPAPPPAPLAPLVEVSSRLWHTVETELPASRADGPSRVSWLHGGAEEGLQISLSTPDTVGWLAPQPNVAQKGLNRLELGFGGTVPLSTENVAAGSRYVDLPHTAVNAASGRASSDLGANATRGRPVSASAIVAPDPGRVTLSLDLARSRTAGHNTIRTGTAWAGNGNRNSVSAGASVGANIGASIAEVASPGPGSGVGTGPAPPREQVRQRFRMALQEGRGLGPLVPTSPGLRGSALGPSPGHDDARDSPPHAPDTQLAQYLMDSLENGLGMPVPVRLASHPRSRSQRSIGVYGSGTTSSSELMRAASMRSNSSTRSLPVELPQTPLAAGGAGRSSAGAGGGAGDGPDPVQRKAAGPAAGFSMMGLLSPFMSGAQRPMDKPS